MVTISTIATKAAGLQAERIVSGQGDPTTPDTVEIDDPVNEFLTHHFISIKQYDSAGALDVATAGTYTVTVKTQNAEQFEAISGSPIDATAPVTLNFAGNVKAIRVVPAGITGDPTAFEVVLTSHGY